MQLLIVLILIVLILVVFEIDVFYILSNFPGRFCVVVVSLCLLTSNLSAEHPVRTPTEAIVSSISRGGGKLFWPGQLPRNFDEERHRKLEKHFP